MKNLKSENTPCLGDSYTVTAGDHSGKILIFVSKKQNQYNFLSYPDAKNHEIDKKEFENGIENYILDYLERVPSYVRKTVKAQFKKNQQEMVGPSD